ncbi:MAG: hypothetical protein ETSY2_44090 [Candidatus Entotheonella gemina]|uniref:CD-NTase-associated protein 12/Pycsar effector protein TIR domain-containing protein n=1 Tax=Candidatus Entotheonella gemina TaxID=1429439 RepID=W4LJ19_9BACT|nr:MAG: hypothetical protein ETSY2_44090 [Candidatus Entotheonella gemina]
MRKRLEQVLYLIWARIVDVRVQSRASNPGDEIIGEIKRKLDTEYPETIHQFKGITSTAQRAMRAKVFIGSSRNSLRVAEEVQTLLQLHDDIEASLWLYDPVFALGNSTLDGLFNAVDTYDFGVFVFGPDDMLVDNAQPVFVPRDNLIFEYGLFLGKLGRKRAYVIKANQSTILTDLSGITIAQYDAQNPNIHAALGTPCRQVRDAILGEWRWPLSATP